MREGVVPGHPPPAAPVQEVFVHGLLGGARHGGLLGDQRAVGVEAARPVAPAVVDVAALVPLPGDGVPVEAVAPADLAEVRLQPELPVHVQLAHDVPLFQSRSFLPVLLGGKSISTLVRSAKVRWRGWRNCIGAVGNMRWCGWCNLYWHLYTCRPTPTAPGCSSAWSPCATRGYPWSSRPASSSRDGARSSTTTTWRRP